MMRDSLKKRGDEMANPLGLLKLMVKKLVFQTGLLKKLVSGLVFLTVRRIRMGIWMASLRVGAIPVDWNWASMRCLFQMLGNL